MNIVIVGGGTVGGAICAQLAGENHDITVVDSDFSVLNELSSRCDVFGVAGNGADISVLRKAGAEKADLLIAVTSGDEINILCCAAAKKLGTTHTIARVRNPEYTDLMQLMKGEMNLSLTINPERAVANEVYKMLRSPYATKIDYFCRGRVELAEFTVSADSPMCNITLNELRNKLNMRFLVCAVLRDGVAHIPTGYFSLEEGDVVSVTAPDRDITRFFKAVGIYKHPVKDVVIVGGGRTTYYLEDLLRDSKINSTVIEADESLCDELAKEFDCTVLCDDGTSQDVLLEQGIGNADAFIALSDVDEENAIVSMYAKTQNTKKVITMISTMSYIDLFKGVGLDSIVSPKTSTASIILRYVRSMANVRGSEIESLHKIMDEQIEVLEFTVKEEIEDMTGIPIKELKLREGVLIACIVHDNKITIPSGADIISDGDTVIIVTSVGKIKGLKEILK